jgi:hypothetical protein
VFFKINSFCGTICKNTFLVKIIFIVWYHCILARGSGGYHKMWIFWVFWYQKFVCLVTKRSSLTPIKIDKGPPSPPNFPQVYPHVYHEPQTASFYNVLRYFETNYLIVLYLVYLKYFWWL